MNGFERENNHDEMEAILGMFTLPFQLPSLFKLHFNPTANASNDVVKPPVN